MSYDGRPSIARRAGLVLWGMFTLALLFSVFLLARQLIDLGQNPLSVAVNPPPPETATVANADRTDGTQSVNLYFADPDGRLLSPESRNIEIGDSTLENCRRAVQEIIAGPRTALTAILPNSTRVRALYALKGGELVVDFSKELAAGRRWSASTESLLIYALANTLTQSALRGDQGEQVTRIRVLMEGAALDASDTFHIDLSLPYGPDPAWIRVPSEDAKANG